MFAKMRDDLGQAEVESSRGRSKERTIKAKPRPKFPVRRRGTQPVTRIRQTTVLIC